MTNITQRGNRRLDVFHCDAQRRLYLQLRGQYAADRGRTHFYRAFIRHEGISPTEYRRKRKLESRQPNRRQLPARKQYGVSPYNI